MLVSRILIKAWISFGFYGDSYLRLAWIGNIEFSLERKGKFLRWEKIE